jgi:hypothetical protein
MRRPVVPFAFFAWVVLMLQPCAARAAACCLEEVALRTPAPFDEGRAEAVEEAAPPAVASPAPTPLDLSSGQVADKPSYKDVFRVLKDDNACSRFFGGPRLAVTVFNEFALQLRLKRLGQNYIGVVMTGEYTNYLDMRTGRSYRLFGQASLNSEGPFRTRVSKVRMRVGSFPAETRQARALMLLHELGHLIRGKDGRWLLPNDGGDPVLSEGNTERVESHCRAELFALDK